jgi:hypothetical protein
MVDEWGRIWKDVVVAESRHMAFAFRDRGKQQMSSISTDSVWVKI